MNQTDKEIPNEENSSEELPSVKPSTKSNHYSILKRTILSKILSVDASLFLLFTGIGVLILAFIFLIWNSSGTMNKDANVDFFLLNNFGAFEGGLVGSLWALAGVILFYIALQDQKKYIETNQKAFEKQVEALDVQINEFKLQKDELRLTREVFTEQSKTQKLQRFEMTFFIFVTDCSYSSIYNFELKKPPIYAIPRKILDYVD